MINSCNFRKVDNKYVLFICYTDKATGKTNTMEHILNDVRDVIIMIESCSSQEEIYDSAQLSLNELGMM